MNVRRSEQKDQVAAIIARFGAELKDCAKPLLSDSAPPGHHGFCGYEATIVHSRAGPAEDGPLNALGGHAPESTEIGDLAAGGAHAWGRLLKQKIGSHPAGRSNSPGDEIMDETKTALDQEIPLPLELTRRSDELARRRRELRGCAWTLNARDGLSWRKES